MVTLLFVFLIILILWQIGEKKDIEQKLEWYKNDRQEAIEIIAELNEKLFAAETELFNAEHQVSDYEFNYSWIDLR